MTPNIALTYDLRSAYLAEGYSEEQVAEFDMESTIDALRAAIESLGYRVDPVGHIRHLCRRLARGDRWDLVFNICEGLHGRCREAQVPALLEAYQLPYTFSDPLVCALTLDKALTKRHVRSFGLPTPRFHLVRTPDEIADIRLPWPLFAKPVAEGTGKGIDDASRIESTAQLETTVAALLQRYRQPVLVEEYLPGREFTVAILGNGPDARALGVMEIRIPESARNQIYSYLAKENCEAQVQYLPLPRGPLHEKLCALALQAHNVLECRDVSRVDFRCDAQGEPAFLEINPLPGLHPHHSDLPMIATQEGMTYRELIEQIVTAAWSRRENCEVVHA